MASPVEICNVALGQLGAYRVTDIENPETPNEQLCSLYYPIVRDLMLESRDWSFLVKRATLSTPNLEIPNWGYGQSFKLPNDCYRIMEARRNTQADTQNSLQWRKEGKNIVCDTDVVYIRYISRDVFASDYTGSFVMAFAMVLAAKMCVQVTENGKLKINLLQEAQFAIDEAAALDGMQGRHETIRANQLNNARFNGNGGIR